ncbi:MAG: hypothetical protein JWO36_4381 [Myxococcales bacterium]|nr:hypothetical protein [Myxococcales bacterium]
MLEERRALNLKRFHEYRLKRVYPHNTYEPGLKNVWTDEQGHLCAVATLMKDEGLETLVQAIGLEQNFVRIADVDSGPVIDWVLSSGLTQEEIVMIQQPSAADVEEMEADARWQKRELARRLRREDARLAKNYSITERTLKQPLIAKAGLDLAVARLAQRPDLAAQVLASAAPKRASF